MFSKSSRRAIPIITRSKLASSPGLLRTFADGVTKPVLPKPRGGGLSSRISSFLVGAGLMALVSQFFIFKELREGNDVMLAKQKEVETRLSKLERK